MEHRRKLVHLTNLTTSQIIPSSAMSVSINPATNVATIAFPGLPGTYLPDGNYHAVLDGDGVTDGAGNPLGTDVTLDFFFLQGDANRDRRVNLLDFNILAANFGQSNRTFSQGDFNYDGEVVGLADFNILAANFGRVLPEPTSRAPIVTGGTRRELLSLRQSIVQSMTTMPSRFSTRIIEELEKLIGESAQI